MARAKVEAGSEQSVECVTRSLLLAGKCDRGGTRPSGMINGGPFQHTPVSSGTRI